MPPEAVAIMNRDLPGYLEEMKRRGVRGFGRELDLPDAAVTVRVRNGETLVTDGPFAETKEFVAGVDLLDCADLDEAIEVEARSPVARFLPFEVRPAGPDLRLGAGEAAFARGEDSAGVPYLLTVRVGGTAAAPLLDEALLRECEAWRMQLDAQGFFVLGTTLGGPETATTLRVRDGKTHLTDGPFLDSEEFIAGIEIVSCADRDAAIELAAAHPLAHYHAIEVRSFWSK